MTKIGWATILIILSALAGYSMLVVCQSPANLKPVAAFHVFDGSRSVATSVVLDGSFSVDPDGSIVSFQWIFGDGTSGSGEKIEHMYSRNGLFTVSLVVIDNHGASHMVTRTIDLGTREQETVWSARMRASARLPIIASSTSEGSEVGNRAPAFTLPTLDGDIIQLSACLGHVVIVDFWFSNCSGCISSLPHLEELRAQFEDDGLVILIIVLDRELAQAEAFFADDTYNGFILAYEHDWNRPTRAAYEVKGTPHAFLIDRSGVIRYSGSPINLTAKSIAARL